MSPRFSALDLAQAAEPVSADAALFGVAWREVWCEFCCEAFRLPKPHEPADLFPSCMSQVVVALSLDVAAPAELVWR